MAWNFEVLLEPIGLTEGPVWYDESLLFTNIPNSRIMRYDPDDGQVSVWREHTNPGQWPNVGWERSGERMRRRRSTHGAVRAEP